MKIAKWGNSLAVRLPKDVVEAMNLVEGDEICLRRAADGDVVLERVARRRETVELLKALEGNLPADFKFDREEANRRG